MKKIVIFFLFIEIFSSTKANHWTVASLPFFNNGIAQLYTDANFLYAVGDITDPPGMGNYTYFCRYNGIQWTNFGIFGFDFMDVLLQKKKILLFPAIARVIPTEG